jgi:hypothetical protein
LVFDVELLDLMSTTVKWAPSTGLSGGGVQVFGTSSTIQARIESGNRLVRDQTGKEVASAITLFLRPTDVAGTTFMPKVKDQITLPAPYAPTNPQIIAVRIIPDAESQGGEFHHYELSL